jgi:hypothetical protein
MITRRGKIVLVVTLTTTFIAVVWGIVEVVSHFWWTQNGYCWGDMSECYLGGL